MEQTPHKARQVLLEYNIKATPQRIAVYNALSELRHGCAEDVIQYVQRDTPTVTVATIYNVLECFVKSKIISMVSTSQNRMYFDITSPDHHHLISSDSQQLADYHDPQLDRLMSEYMKIADFGDFEVDTVSIQFKGRFVNKEQVK